MVCVDKTKKIAVNSGPFVTHPGKLGDLLWATSTMSALWDLTGRNPDLRNRFLTSRYCEPLLPLLRAQPYIATADVIPEWEITSDCPGLQPWKPPNSDYLVSYNLGMREWPSPTILEYTARQAAVIPTTPPFLRSAKTRLKWHPSQNQRWICIGFTDEWVELKAGLVVALAKAFPDRSLILMSKEDSRLSREFRFPANVIKLRNSSFEEASEFLIASALFVGCKSALRVLALGLGCPTVVVEPSAPRHNPVFDPPRGFAPRERILNGFDARQMVALVVDALSPSNQRD